MIPFILAMAELVGMALVTWVAAVSIWKLMFPGSGEKN